MFSTHEIGLVCKDKRGAVVKEFKKMFNYMLKGRCKLWWLNIGRNYILYRSIQCLKKNSNGHGF
jgi:hypothetical protein